jgi:peptidoglycan hydrolase-like protein with peptidoglycan-binding domain
MQLQKGSRGEEVKELQKMLRSAGYFNYPKDTGYFGDVTEKALKDFQKARGITIDGIFGVQTKNFLANDAKAKALLNSPNINPEQKAIVYSLYKNGDPRLNMFDMGTIVIPEQITDRVNTYQEELAKQDAAQRASSILTGSGGQGIMRDAYGNAVNEASKVYDPYYDALKTYDRANYDNNLESLNRAYNIGEQTLNNDLSADVSDFYTKEANSGVFGSGSRAERLNSIKNKYNNKYNTLYNTASSNLFDTRRQFGYQYGDDEAMKNNNPISRFNVNPTQDGIGQFQIETGGQYNPFGFAGRKQAEKSVQATTDANDYLLGAKNVIPENFYGYKKPTTTGGTQPFTGL